MMKTTEIRNQFIKYFETNGHIQLDSSPLIPQDDPTLLFANAGMNQFKDYFTGKANPMQKRAVTIQKVVRAGGKHNDLENVGFTARHHTFFEMLGNFSFGDYFKSEAIAFAWEFLTKELKLSKDKLYVTVHNSDEEARQLWHKEQGVPLERIFYRDDKDNFWEMGEIGPCGPCSEIFYDHGAEFSDGSDTSKCILDDEGRFVEIWNLVFMQYEKFLDIDNTVKRKPLPNPCVDTGAGLERLAAALQNTYWNYDIDIFDRLKAKLQVLSGKKYTDENYINNFRVVCDHARSATMLITDGVIPSNEGRGYVLRRIIRRATRHLEELGIKKAALHHLVPVVFETLGDVYPQNAINADLAIKMLKIEEEKFRSTLKNGLDLLNKEIKNLKTDTLSGKVAFMLYDTYGFPFDLTQVILQEKGLKVSEVEFEKEMKAQREQSRSSSKFNIQEDDKEKFYKILEKNGPTKFLGYEAGFTKAKVIAEFKDNEYYTLVLDQTTFYAEGGGQVGDQGIISINGKKIGDILDTQKPVEDLIVHYAKLDSPLSVGQEVEVKVDEKRKELIKRNHSATHLLQSALIEILGKHVKQAGSRVSEDSLRFDFTHPEAISRKELVEIESLVNNQVQAALPVKPSYMSKSEATSKGAMALFGEKYGDEVRVLEMGKFSLELCGGTHVDNTNEVGPFVILSESSLASGVRRIEATTSTNATKYLLHRSHTLSQVERELSANSEAILDKVQSLQTSLKKKNKELKELNLALSQNANQDLFQDIQTLSNGIHMATVEGKSISVKDFKNVSDSFVDKNPEAVLFLYNDTNNKLSYLLRTAKKNKEINCSAIIKKHQGLIDGRGGGRPDMAQGSGTTKKKAEFIDVIKTEIGNL